MIDFTKYLYECLPAIYKLEDEYQGSVLQRYLDVLGFAMNLLCNETEDIRKLYDVDHMPMEFLKHYASIFNFPIYAGMPEYLQRKLGEGMYISDFVQQALELDGIRNAYGSLVYEGIGYPEVLCEKTEVLTLGTIVIKASGGE